MVQSFTKCFSGTRVSEIVNKSLNFVLLNLVFSASLKIVFVQLFPDKEINNLEILDNVFIIWHCWRIWYLFAGFKAIILCFVYSVPFVKYQFSAKIWFVKTSTIIMKYKSRVVKSNPDYLGVLTSYMIETKGHDYSMKTLSQYKFKGSVKDSDHQEFSDNPDSSAVDHQYQQVEDVESVCMITSWVWASASASVSVSSISLYTSNALVHCLEKPYDISEPQDLETVVEIMVGHRSWLTRFLIWPNNVFLRFAEMTSHWMRPSGLWRVTNCMCLTWWR